MTGRTNYRWSKYVWGDWFRDAALHSCSLAARGLWADLLCLCHDGEPRGHLTINGRVPTLSEIGRLIGVHPNQIAKLIDELERNRVFSRTADGVIFSRRQVRDHATMEQSIEWGHRGGNPELKRRKSKGNGSGRVNPSHKAERDSDSESESPSPTPTRSAGGAKGDVLNAVKEAAAAPAVPKGAARGRPFRVIAGGSSA
jgi:hypothetical protein